MLDSFYGSWVVDLLKYDSSYFEFALDIRSLSCSLFCSIAMLLELLSFYFISVAFYRLFYAFMGMVYNTVWFSLDETHKAF